MAAIAAVPIFMRNVLLTLKTTVGTPLEFQCHVTRGAHPGHARGHRDHAHAVQFGRVLEQQPARVRARARGHPGLGHHGGLRGAGRVPVAERGQTLTFVLNIHGEASAGIRIAAQDDGHRGCASRGTTAA